MPNKWIYIFILFFILPPGLFGQGIFHKHYSVNDGLPDNCIRTIFKDSRGYVWIGTDTGLSRFDGSTFTNWGTADGLSGLKVWAITEDRDGNMWFGTYDGGISVFDGKCFTVYNTRNSGLPSNKIRALACFPDTNLVYIGTEKGVIIFDGEQFQTIEMPEDGRGLVRVMDFESYHGKVLIAFYTSGLPWAIVSLDPNTLQYEGFVKKERINNLEGKHYHSVSQMLCTNSRIIFSLNRLGITELIDGYEKNFTGTGQVFGISEGVDNEIWLAGWVDESGMAGGGLYLFKNDSIINISEKLGLIKDSGFCSYYDKEDKAIWYGSINNGLVYIPETPFSTEEMDLIGVSGQKIYDLFFDSKNRMWIATPDTLYCKTPENEIRKWTQADCQKVIIDKKIRESIRPAVRKGFDSIEEDSMGNIIISINGLGLFIINNAMKLDFLNFRIGKIKFNDSYNLLSSGKFALPIITIDHLNNPYKEIRVPDFFPPSSTTAVSTIGSDFWIATSDKGLAKYANGETTFFNQTYPFLPNHINCIRILDNKEIVIGSNAGKVYLIKEENNTLELLKTIEASNGLTGSNIRLIEKGPDHDLWIGTDKGINHLNLKTLYTIDNPEISFFDASNGYSDNSGNCSSMDHFGNVWVGTDQHIIKINSGVLNHSTARAAKLQFDKFRLYNYQDGWDSQISKNPWTEMVDDSLTLNHRQNYIGITFKSLNYFNPSQDRFQYILEGYDHNWSEISTQTSAVYSSLPSGDYTFRLKAVNLSGQIHYDDELFHFTILPPFWLRWWFHLLTVIAILGLSWLFFGQRTRIVRRKERRKAAIAAKMHKLEIRALKAQMNPHFVFNAITSIQNCILSNKVDSAVKYLSEFASIIRMTLENVNSDYISMQQELDYINTYLSLEKLRFMQVFDVEISIDSNIAFDSFMIPPLIIQPHIENAIHHGLLPLKKDGRLSIAFNELSEDIIRCTIEDNGIGRAASKKINEAKRGKKHISRGSKISTERIELYNKTENIQGFKIQIIDLYKNNEPSGTRVILDLPGHYRY